MPDPKLTKADYERVVADTVATLLSQGIAPSEPTASGFLGEVLDALKPLQALRPPYGELSAQAAKRFAALQDALRRPDFSKALRPESKECTYATIVFYKWGRQA